MPKGYEELMCAIVLQAVKDYRKALKHGTPREVLDLENWFLGEWGQLLSNDNGAYIIEKVKQDVKGGAHNGRKQN